MSNIVYLKITGQQQGDISDGCGTTESIGNRWQNGHENEILTLSLTNQLTSTRNNANYRELFFNKLIDKSSPLLVNSLVNNEQLFLEFFFYRLNRYGRWDKYYFIQLRGVRLSAISSCFTNNNFDTEMVSVRYSYILCKHLISNTEFYSLVFPEDYNQLFVPSTPNKPGTINSAAAGRLLAAGGIYNGNIQGFRETAEKLGGDAVRGYDQVLNQKTVGAAIAVASVAAGLGVGRLGIASELAQLEKTTPGLHVLGKIEGEYSAINPGPLLSKYAKTFAGGVYKEITLSQDTVFYRSGREGREWGEFLAYEQPLGVLQSRIDKAIRPVWPDGGKSPVNRFYELQIPVGTKVYVGKVGYQTDLYSGGTEQVVVLSPWAIPEAKVLSNGVLK
ncbi:type VI secretion system tube protein TssD [Enterobacter sp.]|uniref:type VI secretion system tube protein TssD n=1 Tax=Enterobacter sp. TaxID=42895 RepID=UPI00296EDC95|nr:type VI secretion system tube protein TssD [Enterobacter sp.]